MPSQAGVDIELNNCEFRRNTVPMPSPRRRRRMGPDDRREQLLQAALRVAARGGTKTVSLTDLTAEAGVSAGLLYHYFPTKEDLLRVAVDRAADDLLAALDPGPVTEPFARALALLHTYLQYVQNHPEPWLALTGSDCEARTRADIALESMLVRALEVDEPGPGLTVVIRGWLGFLRAACRAWIEHPDLQRRAVSNALIDSFVVALEATGWYDGTAKEALGVLHVA